MIAAVVPAKALDQAKGRLAALLSEDERRCLTLAMLEDVVHALKAVPRLGIIAVVSPDDSVLSLARDLGAEAVLEPPSVRGINQALDHARNAVMPRGPDALLVVLADVPTVTSANIESVLDALPEDRGLVICPSTAKGTSALGLRPADVIPFRFGPDSFMLHRREAAARGIPATVLRLDSLAHDIDEAEDLRYLISQPAGAATQRLLAEIGADARLSG